MPAERDDERRPDGVEQRAPSRDAEAADAEGVVAIEASVRARSLRADEPSRTRVVFTGDGRVRTRRRGLPQTGAVPGVTYEHCEIDVSIVARPARQDEGEPAQDGAGEPAQGEPTKR